MGYVQFKMEKISVRYVEYGPAFEMIMQDNLCCLLYRQGVFYLEETFIVDKQIAISCWRFVSTRKICHRFTP